MEALILLRTLGALSAVLALLAGALWAVRRYDLALPGRIGGTKAARVEVAERLNLDAKRSVALIRHGAAEHLLLLAPEGNMLLGEADHADAAALHIDLALCRSLAAPVPPPMLWPARPPMRNRPRRPVLPAIRRA